MDRISVVLNTYNAERHLRKVLESATRFDEIVVCDMESTDSTLDIAKEFGCVVVTFPKGNVSICEPARNTAIQAASNKWVLLIDADEVVPPDLPPFLYGHINGRPDAPALDICRRNLFMGRETTDSCDRQLRFFRKDRVFWPPTIHSRPIVEGGVEKMPAKRKDLYLVHLDDPTVARRVDKLNNYTSNEVVRRESSKFGLGSLLFSPTWSFFRSLILRGGFKDGKRGVIRAQLNAFYRLLLMAKVLEKQMAPGGDDWTPVFPAGHPERILHTGRNRVWIDEFNGGKVAVKEFTPGIWQSIARVVKPDKATLSMRNARELIKRGVLTPRPILVIISRSCLGRIKQAYYVSAYDDASVSLADALSLYGDAVLRAFAEFVAGLHEQGVLHKDLNNTNVRVAADTDGFHFSLIDLNRMKFTSAGTPLPLKESFKNITRFCCHDDTFHKFLNYYFGFRGIDQSKKQDALNAKISHDNAHARKSRMKKLIRK